MNFLTKYKVKTNYIKLDLMMRDITNINRFFRNKGIDVIDNDELLARALNGEEEQ